jgi:hypothetical protein
MTLEVRVWASSIRDGWQVDRARRPSQTRLAGEGLAGQNGGQWLLFYLLAQQTSQQRLDEAKAEAER